jgi:hypothetical protein
MGAERLRLGEDGHLFNANAGTLETPWDVGGERADSPAASISALRYDGPTF